MLKSLALLCIFGAGSAQAQACPDFYRFVDFGLEGRDGVLYRGGPVFRAEGFTGLALLRADRTICRTVPELARDGHGIPIPVVGGIDYDPEVASLDLRDLRLTTTEDPVAAAVPALRAHEALLRRAGADLTRGEAYLCAAVADRLSCQVQSPYPGDTPLIVSCDAATCTMSVLALSDGLQVSAAWDGAAIFSDPDTAGPVILERIESIEAFLTPLSASLQ